MTFEEYAQKQMLSQYATTVAYFAWQAAQQAERDRAKVLLDALKSCDEAMEYMSEYDIPLGLPQKVKAAIAKYEGKGNG